MVICKKNITGSILFCVAFFTIYLLTRNAFPEVKYSYWSMCNDTGDSSPSQMRGTKVIFDNALVKAFQETLSRILKDKFTKGAGDFKTVKIVSNETFEEFYKMANEKRFRVLGINSHDIKFVHKLPMLTHFIWISNDIRTKNNYDSKTEKNLKTFLIYEKIGWKIIVWDNKKVFNIFCTDNNNKDLCEILTNTTLTKKYKITLSMKSDMLRFFIIYEFGGMYFDTDFIALRNTDHIIRDNIGEHGLIVAHEINESRSTYLAGEFFVAYPGNVFFENARNHVVSAIKGTEMSNIRTGPFFFKKALVSTYFDNFNIDLVVMSTFNLSKVATVLPTEYLYSFPFKRKTDMALLAKVKKLPTTYFIHLWRGSWLKN